MLAANVILAKEIWATGWIAITLAIVIDLIAVFIGSVVVAYSTFQRKKIFDRFVKSVNKQLSNHKIKNRSNSTYMEHWHEFTFATNLRFLAEEYVSYQRAKAIVVVTKQEEWDESLHDELDQTLNNLLPELSAHLKLTKNIKQVIGNRSFSPVRKLVLVRTANDYLNKKEMTINLGTFKGLQRPPDPQPVKKRVKTKGVIEPAIETRQTRIVDDTYITLKDYIEKYMPLGTILNVIPQDHDPFMVRAILVDLIEPGKTISMAGGWKRKQEHIMKKVFNMYSVEGITRPSEKLFKKELNWLRQIGVLEKRSHGNDYSINFLTTDKSEVSQQLIKLALTLKSARNSENKLN